MATMKATAAAQGGHVLTPLPRSLAWWGTVVRDWPRFKGKGRLRQWLERNVRGKGYVSTVALRSGERMVLDLDDWIPWCIFSLGGYDIESVAEGAMLGAVRPGMTILDIGANIGYYTLQFATRVGPTGQVHAFEPVSTTYASLSRNIAENALQNVRANRLVVSDAPGEVEMFFAGHDKTGQSSTVEVYQGSSSERVPATTVDAYLREQGVGRVDLVKMDVEGHELTALRGMSELLARPDAPDLYVEICERVLLSHGATAAELVGFLRGQGYLAFRITPDGPVPAEPDMTEESLAWFTKRASSR